jgi:hypothetical protein
MVTMKIFISWSGLRSQKLANKIREWPPLVIQNIEQLYLSSGDITAGSNWRNSLSSELQACNFGIICLTPENLRAPWIHYEAGALSKAVDNSKSHVAPMLFDLKPSDLKESPLEQFQAVLFDKNGMHKVLISINNALTRRILDEHQLDQSFEQWWPSFETFLKTIEANIKKVNTRITFSLKDPQGRELAYPLKCYVDLQNQSMDCIDVSLTDYIERTVPLKQFVTDVLQVNLAGWYPRPDGVGRLAVLPGQLFRAWVGFDEEKYTKEEVQKRLGEIGTLVFSVNGDALHVNI